MKFQGPLNRWDYNPRHNYQSSTIQNSIKLQRTSTDTCLLANVMCSYSSWPASFWLSWQSTIREWRELSVLESSPEKGVEPKTTFTSCTSGQMHAVILKHPSCHPSDYLVTVFSIKPQTSRYCVCIYTTASVSTLLCLYLHYCICYLFDITTK